MCYGKGTDALEDSQNTVQVVGTNAWLDKACSHFSTSWSFMLISCRLPKTGEICCRAMRLSTCQLRLWGWACSKYIFVTHLSTDTGKSSAFFLLCWSLSVYWQGRRRTVVCMWVTPEKWNDKARERSSRSPFRWTVRQTLHLSYALYCIVFFRILEFEGKCSAYRNDSIKIKQEA